MWMRVRLHTYWNKGRFYLDNIYSGINFLFTILCPLSGEGCNKRSFCDFRFIVMVLLMKINAEFCDLMVKATEKQNKE